MNEIIPTLAPLIPIDSGIPQTFKDRYDAPVFIANGGVATTIEFHTGTRSIPLDKIATIDQLEQLRNEFKLELAYLRDKNNRLQEANKALSPFKKWRLTNVESR